MVKLEKRIQLLAVVLACAHSSRIKADDTTGDAVVEEGCFQGPAGVVVHKCNSLHHKERCCQSKHPGVSACDWPASMDVTICPGSCNGDESCVFGIDNINLYDSGQEIYIGPYSCNGMGACKAVGEFPTAAEVPKPTNAPILIASGSCIGHMNACYQYHGHFIGYGSCKSPPFHQASCEGAAGDIGPDSCIGHGSCALSQGSVGRHSCHGQDSCYSVQGGVGNMACTCEDGCVDAGSVGDCFDVCGPNQHCSDVHLKYSREKQACELPQSPEVFDLPALEEFRMQIGLAENSDL